jgi:hypothetical protein
VLISCPLSAWLSAPSEASRLRQEGAAPGNTNVAGQDVNRMNGPMRERGSLFIIPMLLPWRMVLAG